MLEKEYRRVNSLGVGEKMLRPVFIDKLEERKTKEGKGNPYVTFTVSDSSCSVKANRFQDKEGRPVTIGLLSEYGIGEGMLVTMELEKNERGFVNVVRISKNIDPDVRIQDFAHKTDGSADERFKNIIDILKDAGTERRFLFGEEGSTISDLAVQLYMENEELLKWSSAAELMHSEKAGGLMEHTEAMVRNAVKVCEVYPDLDKELLVTAAALHDIGKIEELDTNPLGRAEYRPVGIGIGHIVLGYTYVDRMVQKNPGTYPEERVLLLESLILSHHGEKAYGSPIEPVVKEAYMLFYIDEMDAKYHEMKKATEELTPGQISPTSKVLGINHKVYCPKEED